MPRKEKSKRPGHGPYRLQCPVCSKELNGLDDVMHHCRIHLHYPKET